MPHFVRYRIYAPIVRFFMFRVLKYRLAVVEKNIERCMPELNDAEKRAIRDKFYTYLSEIIISTISMVRSSVWRDAYPKHGNANIEELRTKLNGESAIILMGHYGIWEYLIFFGIFSEITSIGAYHPLENKVANELFKRFRTHYKGFTLPSNEVVRFAMKHGKKYNGEGYLLGLIADQNPPMRRDTNWYKFLAEETIFFDGAEKVAQKLAMPVYYIDQVRMSAGRYKLQYSEVWNGTENIKPTEITRRYVKLLEQSVRRAPELWLWSHRRFKKSKKWQMNRFKIEERKTIE